MKEPCYYCGEKHYEAIDVEACLRDALKREDIAYKSLARSYEDLVKTHDLEHAMIERLVAFIKVPPPAAATGDPLVAQIAAAEELLARHHHPYRPEQKG